MLISLVLALGQFFLLFGLMLDECSLHLKSCLRWAIVAVRVFASSLLHLFDARDFLKGVHFLASKVFLLEVVKIVEAKYALVLPRSLLLFDR